MVNPEGGKNLIQILNPAKKEIPNVALEPLQENDVHWTSIRLSGCPAVKSREGNESSYSEDCVERWRCTLNRGIKNYCNLCWWSMYTCVPR